MTRSPQGAAVGVLVGAALGYVAARSIGPQYDQGTLVLGVAIACCLAFGPNAWSFLRDRLGVRG
jgi:uncharacterized membrane protein YgaE (UPF0421/DUF939 family)